VNPSLSLGKTPTYSNGNTTVTVNLKNYKWANGESVTAQDVLFFMNIYHAQKANFCGYVPKALPRQRDQRHRHGHDGDVHLQPGVQPHWILYNELSQITPHAGMRGTSPAPALLRARAGAPPRRTAPTTPACTKVYTFLANAAGFNPSNPSAANNSLSTYATNPLWQVVDGPWKLKPSTLTARLHFVPNPSYSGPVKPTLKSFTELPYTSDTRGVQRVGGGQPERGVRPGTVTCRRARPIPVQGRDRTTRG
jgi:peptide/nickel transport system substrate-binding protein